MQSHRSRLFNGTMLWNIFLMSHHVQLYNSNYFWYLMCKFAVIFRLHHKKTLTQIRTWSGEKKECRAGQYINIVTSCGILDIVMMGFDYVHTAQPYNKPFQNSIGTLNTNENRNASLLVTSAVLLFLDHQIQIVHVHIWNPERISLSVLASKPVIAVNDISMT